MNKWIYISTIVVIVIIAIFTGIYLFKQDGKDEQYNNNQIINEFKKTDNIAKNVMLNDIPISSIETEKISPNATLILKKHYKECNHIIREYLKIPEEYVNLTKDELKKKEDGWKIDSFSKDELILIKQLSGVCNEHYVLRQKDGIIAVYKINKDNTETLQEETGIAVEYLTKEDRVRLEEGIRIYGNEELNSALEDYE